MSNGNYIPNPNGGPGMVYQPPKKHTLRNVLLAVVGVLVVLIIAAAVGGSNSATVTDSSGKSVIPSGSFTSTPTATPTTKTTPQSKKDTNLPQKLVKGAQVGPFVLTASVRVSKDGLGSFTSKVNAKNTSNEEQMAMFKITLLKGDDILGTLDCIGGGGSPIKAGATMTAQCISTDNFVGGWTQVQLEHTGF